MMNKNNSKAEDVNKEVNEDIASNKVEELEKEIDELKSNVKSLSDELKSAVVALKKSIVDVRSAISEIENPFNLLRSISSEEDLKRLTQEEKAAQPVEVKSIFIGKPEEATAPANVESVVVGEPEKKVKEEVEAEQIEEPERLLVSEKTTQPEELQEISEKEDVREQVKRMKAPTRPYLPLKLGARYLEWIWSLLYLGFSASEISSIAEFYEYLGYLPTGLGKKLSLMASVLRNTESRGVSKIGILLNMYKTAALSDVKITSDDQYVLFSMIENFIKQTSELKNRGGK